MRVKFKKGDPRAGMVVNLDEAAARRAIDAGEAEEVTGKAAETDADRATADATGGADTAADTDTTTARATTTRTAAKKTGRGR